MGSQAVTSSSRTASRSGPSASLASRPEEASGVGAPSCRVAAAAEVRRLRVVPTDGGRFYEHADPLLNGGLRGLSAERRLGGSRQSRANRNSDTAPAAAPPVRSTETATAPAPGTNSLFQKVIRTAGTTTVMYLASRGKICYAHPPGTTGIDGCPAACAGGGRGRRWRTATGGRGCGRTPTAVRRAALGPRRRPAATPPPCRMALVVSSEATSTAFDRAPASHVAASWRPVHAVTACSTASRAPVAGYGRWWRCGPVPLFDGGARPSRSSVGSLVGVDFARSGRAPCGPPGSALCRWYRQTSGSSQAWRPSAAAGRESNT